LLPGLVELATSLDEMVPRSKPNGRAAASLHHVGVLACCRAQNWCRL